MNSKKNIFTYEGVSTTFYEFGEGETMIFLPGWGSTSQSHLDFFNVLAKRFKIISLDLPGMGKENSPKKIWDFRRYAAYVSEFVNQLPEKKVVMSGHSFGAAIAMYVTAENNMVNKLVLFDAAGLPIEYSRPKLYYKYSKELLSDLLTPRHVHTSKRCISIFLTNSGNLIYKLRLALAVFNKKIAVDDSVFRDITVPVRIFWGDHDFVFTKEAAEELNRKLKGEKVYWIEGSHNWCIFEPDKLLPFLNLI